MRRLLGAGRPAGRTTAATEWTAINACLVPAAALDGQEVVTAEGLGTPDDAAPGAARDGRPRRFAVRLLHAGLRVQHGRGVLPRRPRAVRPERPCTGDHEHGPNGFDLHAMSGNLCRCTGYRPIRDAAWALGHPLADDPLAARLAAPPPAPVATRSTGPTAFARPADLAEALALLAEHPDATVRRRLHRLGRRGQHPRRRGRRTPWRSTGCPSCASSRSATTTS